ncbi:hypothetical protein L1987_15450 [Smallanthus sonchifolius]|uniref:Uncharacterized protein n=1 Tax=Smallanthus sonchifolius TaxID=185202 RepID=A0ACB9J5I2_9ASTR|nr:hypothetical protein L1987_15450 [Smallanthus sonchifolius]
MEAICSRGSNMYFGCESRHTRHCWRQYIWHSNIYNPFGSKAVAYGAVILVEAFSLSLEQIHNVFVLEANLSMQEGAKDQSGETDIGKLLQISHLCHPFLLPCNFMNFFTNIHCL